MFKSTVAATDLNSLECKQGAIRNFGSFQREPASS